MAGPGESAEQIASYSLHMADSGTDNFDRDFALSLLSADQDALYEIDQALKRIEEEHMRHLRADGQTHSPGAPGGHSLDALYRAGSGPAQAEAPCGSAAWPRWALWMPPARRSPSPKTKTPKRNPKEKE